MKNQDKPIRIFLCAPRALEKQMKNLITRLVTYKGVSLTIKLSPYINSIDDLGYKTASIKEDITNSDVFVFFATDQSLISNGEEKFWRNILELAVKLKGIEQILFFLYDSQTDISIKYDDVIKFNDKYIQLISLRPVDKNVQSITEGFVSRKLIPPIIEASTTSVMPETSPDKLSPKWVTDLRLMIQSLWQKTPQQVKMIASGTFFLAISLILIWLLSLAFGVEECTWGILPEEICPSVTSTPAEIQASTRSFVAIGPNITPQASSQPSVEATLSTPQHITPIVISAATQEDASPNAQIFYTSDIFVLKIANEMQSNELASLEIHVGSEQPIQLSNLYESDFAIGAPFEEGYCFFIKERGSNTPIPDTCTPQYTTPIERYAFEFFWYDRQSDSFRTFEIWLSGKQVATCRGNGADCSFSIP